MLKIGLISYLNAYPYSYPLTELKHGRSDWTYTSERPGVLNKKMRQAELDISFVSAMEYASNFKDYWISPGLSLSSRGYVDSVRLVSNLPIEELNDQEVHITGASATSVAALKVLLHESGVNNAKFTSFPAEDIVPQDCVAALVIGDEALRLSEFSFEYSYDIGELWQKHFQRNIVFALGVIRRTENEDKIQELSRFAELAQRCPELSFADEDTFQKSCLDKYPKITEPMAYLKRLHFGLDDLSRSNLEFFFNKVYEIGLVKEPVPLEFFTIAQQWA